MEGTALQYIVIRTEKNIWLKTGDKAGDSDYINQDSN